MFLCCCYFTALTDEYGPYIFTVCDAVCTDTVFGCGAWLFIGVGCIFCIADSFPDFTLKTVNGVA